MAAQEVPVSVERTDGRVKYTMPNATVDMEVMEGADGGQPGFASPGRIAMNDRRLNQGTRRAATTTRSCG